uniref:Uncharacterized protein n=1 Tax=Babesia bovis TaxID=5865 RepID=S6BKQ6_BABBO|nr:hypothetical protein [Babesia bovis]BAN65884.1 hypothetical protein [Babesia bovis]
MTLANRAQTHNISNICGYMYITVLDRYPSNRLLPYVWECMWRHINTYHEETNALYVVDA